MCLERMYEMEIIICNILIALIGVGITPYMKNLIEAFNIFICECIIDYGCICGYEGTDNTKRT